MDLLVIGLVVDPTAIDNANPFESESADGGRVLETAAAHLVVVGASPGRVSDGLSGELVKGLSDEMGASQSSVDQTGFATFLGDRRNAGVGLQVGSRLPSGAVGAQSDQQAWRAHGSSARKTDKEVVVGVSGRRRPGGALRC